MAANVKYMTSQSPNKLASWTRNAYGLSVFGTCLRVPAGLDLQGSRTPRRLRDADQTNGRQRQIHDEPVAK